MLNISQEAKNQYLNDDRVQRIFISYDDIVLTDSNIMMSSLSLDEPLCTDDNLVFGGAEAKMLKLKLLNTKLEINNLTGKKIYVNSLIAKQINNMNVGNIYYTAVVNSSLGMIAISGDRNRLLKVDEKGKILLKIRLDKKGKCLVIKDNNIYVVPFNTNDVVDVYAIGEQGFVHTDTINLEAYQKEQIAGMLESIVYEDGVYKEYVDNKEYVFESVPYGYFICEKPVKEKEYIISLTAYDELIKFDIDITEWWNGLSYPLTIDDMFKSLCDYCGVPYEETTHINGDYTFNAKPADLSNIKGRDVLKMIGQATCTFIKMTRYGKCVMKTIDVDTINYELDLLKEDIDVSEYSTAPIDKVQIRVEEDDIGVIVGEGTNAYVIQGNYLLYSQSDEQLRPYAENIYDVVSQIVYRPYSLNTVELPFIEAGDVIKVTTISQTFNALVMNRELSSGNDMFSADGTESREIVTDVNSSIINLQGKVNVLKRDIDETISLIKDPATGLESQITQQAGKIELIVQSDTYPNLLTDSLFENKTKYYDVVIPSTVSSGNITFLDSYQNSDSAVVKIEATATQEGKYGGVNIRQSINIDPSNDLLWVGVNAITEFQESINSYGLILGGQITVFLYDETHLVSSLSWLISADNANEWKRSIKSVNIANQNIIKANIIIGVYVSYPSSSSNVSQQTIYIQKPFVAVTKSTDVINADVWNNGTTTSLGSKIQQQSDSITLAVEKTGFKNLIINSDFSNISENTAYSHAPYAWATYESSPALTTSVLENSEFTNGRSLRINRPSGSTDQFYQKINTNYTKSSYNYYVSFDYKANSLPSNASYGFHTLFYFSDGTNGWATTITSMNGAFPSVGQYKRMMYKVGITPSSEKKLIAVALHPIYFYNNTDAYDIEIGGIMMVDADLGQPGLYAWSDIGTNDVVSMINLTPDTVKIQAEKIDLLGVTTIRDSSGGGYTKITGSTIETSTINSTTINTSTLKAAKIEDLQSVNGVAVNATGSISVPNWNGYLIRFSYNNGIATGWVYGSSVPSPYGTPNGSWLFVGRLNGSACVYATSISDGNGGYISAPSGNGYPVFARPNGMLSVVGANADTQSGATYYPVTSI